MLPSVYAKRTASGARAAHAANARSSACALTDDAHSHAQHDSSADNTLQLKIAFQFYIRLEDGGYDFSSACICGYRRNNGVTPVLIMKEFKFAKFLFQINT